MLNRCASEFFCIVQHVLLNDVQLTLSRLADLPATGANKNATLRALQELIFPLNDSQLNSDLNKLVEDYRQSCQHIRNRRNKMLAHADYEAFLSSFGHGAAAPMEGPSRAEIEAALVHLRGFMNRIERHFSGSETAYEHSITIHDGESLLQILKHGVRYGELVTNGAISATDLRDRGFPEV